MRAHPKAGFLVLEAINAFAMAYYFNYLFFYLQKQFGFGSIGNLTFSALNGFVYIFSSLYAGRFAQRRGYILSLRVGFLGMATALTAGLFLPVVRGQLAALLLWTISICFTWPALEALVTDGEDSRSLPRMVGIYNMVWASGAAIAFFSGGVLVQLLGWKSIFWLPASLHLVQLVLTFWNRASIPRDILDRGSPSRSESALTQAAVSTPRLAVIGTAAALESRGPLVLDPIISGTIPPALARTFLRMAWAANPLAYVAINTVLPLMPEIARRLKLPPMEAGFVCSVFMFARLSTFAALWRWSGWHYRFSWLLSAYVLLILSFASLLLSPFLWAVVIAQLVFGWSIGLIYYSSLFYSMDASDAKGVHGGFHEAAIGLGIFTGPAMGACALFFFPHLTHVSAWAVSALLVSGFFLVNGLKRSGDDFG